MPGGRGGLLSILGRPFLYLNNALKHWQLGEWFLQRLFSTRSLLRRMMKFESSSTKIAGEGSEAIAVDWPSAKTMANPLWWILWSGQFVWRWFLSRPFLSLVVATPGIVVAFIAVAGAVLGMSRQQGDALTYRAKMVEAVEAEEFEKAQFLGDIAISLAPRSEELIHERALVDERAGQPESARAIMTHNAETNGALKSISWLAENLGDRNQLASWTPEARSEYGKWLNMLLDRMPANDTARKALAELLRVEGNAKGAYEALLPLASKDDASNYMVIVLEKELGLTESAAQRATESVKSLRKRIAANPADLTLRIQTASLLVFLEDIDKAIETLDAGRAHATTEKDENLLRRALADGHVLLANKIASTDKTPLGLMKRFESLRRAVAYDATSKAVIDAVSTACVDAANSTQQEIRVLKEAIVRGIHPDASHFILGTLALKQGDVKQAMHHLAIAKESNPSLPGLLNNLAYAMLLGDSDIEEALRLANAAVRMTPMNAYARETRGQILLKLGKWSEAISDLEFALGEQALVSHVRPGLATAYEQIGQPDVAARHRYLAEKGS